MVIFKGTFIAGRTRDIDEIVQIKMVTGNVCMGKPRIFRTIGAGPCSPQNWPREKQQQKTQKPQNQSHFFFLLCYGEELCSISRELSFHAGPSICQCGSFSLLFFHGLARFPRPPVGRIILVLLCLGDRCGDDAPVGTLSPFRAQSMVVHRSYGPSHVRLPLIQIPGRLVQGSEKGQ